MIEFEWETFEETDDTWEALFVRINRGRWVLAQAKYGTEDEDLIRKMIYECN